MNKRYWRGTTLTLLPLVLALGCGGSSESANTDTANTDTANTDAAKAAIQQTAEMAANVIERADEVSDEWPFTHREVDAMRSTNRTEYLKKGTYTETLIEYVRPNLLRDVTTVLSKPGEEPTVAERVQDGENTYMWMGGKLMTVASPQSTTSQIDDALRLNTSLSRLEDAHKMRQFMLERQGTEELDGKEMIVWVDDDLNVFLAGEQVKGTQRTWVGADDGLVYKLVREAESASAHERSTMTYEYGDSITIEIPTE